MKRLLFLGFTLCMGASIALAGTDTKRSKKQKTNDWNTFKVGEVIFNDLSPDAPGSVIYNSIIPNPSDYITENACEVLRTLYFGPTESIPTCTTIVYEVLDYDGISTTRGGADIL